MAAARECPRRLRTGLDIKHVQIVLQNHKEPSRCEEERLKRVFVNARPSDNIDF
jgi:hypothetical protein